MIINQIKSKLGTQYVIDHYIDLAEYDTKPVSELYLRIQLCKKDEFGETERIVFIAAQPLKKTFGDLPCDILNSVQRYIQYFDIPHFFVIIVSDVETIAEDLEFLRANYNPQELKAIPHIKYVQNQDPDC
jgi:hypothetical protein